MTAVSLKEVQSLLNVLGATPRLVEDGVMGPKTKAAVQSFQKRMGLAQTGTLDRATLDAMGFKGLTLGGIDADAYAVAKRARPDLSEAQLQYALTIARGEGYYGRGWANPIAATIAASQKLGLTGYEGAGSNNWGAVQGTGNAGSFPHVDYHADGSPYIGTFRKYATPEDGFRDVAKVLFSGGLRKAAGAAALNAAIARGSLKEAVEAQHANGYFELAPAKYLEAVTSNYQKLTDAIGWPRLLSAAGITPGKAGAGFLF